MSFLINFAKPDHAPLRAKQVCARGWQDYMMETNYFLGESRVDACLKSFSQHQLEKLGLSESAAQKVRAR